MCIYCICIYIMYLYMYNIFINTYNIYIHIYIYVYIIYISPLWLNCLIPERRSTKLFFIIQPSLSGPIVKISPETQPAESSKLRVALVKHPFIINDLVTQDARVASWWNSTPGLLVSTALRWTTTRVPVSCGDVRADVKLVSWCQLDCSVFLLSIKYIYSGTFFREITSNTIYFQGF